MENPSGLRHWSEHLGHSTPMAFPGKQTTKAGTVAKPSLTRDGKALNRQRVAGSSDRSRHQLRADKQRVNGAYRTAGPDHDNGSSDPMFPKPLHARTPDRFAVKGEVYHSTVSAHVGCGVGSLLVSERKLVRLIKSCGRPKGAHPNEVRVSGRLRVEYPFEGLHETSSSIG